MAGRDVLSFNAMIADDLPLPDDLDLLKSMVRAMAQKAAVLEDENAALKARSADADERIKRLMQILKAYDRARFGRRSEKLGPAGHLMTRTRSRLSSSRKSRPASRP